MYLKVMRVRARAQSGRLIDNGGGIQREYIELLYERMMEPMVSIIVPIYNVEPYVQRCLDSLVYQTYKNIEVIAVDDGSKDNCADIIDEYSYRDNRVIAIHKKNGGLSSARNAGFEVASGDYILYVDGDDFLDRNTIEHLVKKALENDTSIVLFPYIREFSKHSIKTRLFDSGNKYFSKEESKENLFTYLIGPGKKQDQYNPLRMDRLNTAWGKFYKKTAIEGISFIDTSEIGVEDGLYNIEVFSQLDGSVFYTEDVWYHYEKGNGGSLLHSYRLNYFEKRWNFYNRVRMIIKERECKEFEINLYNRIILELFNECVNIASSKKKLSEQAKYLKCGYMKFGYAKLLNKFEFNKLSCIWKLYYGLLKYRCFYAVMFLTNVAIKIKG